MEDQLYYNMFQDRLERELLKLCSIGAAIELHRLGYEMKKLQ